MTNQENTNENQNTSPENRTENQTTRTTNPNTPLTEEESKKLKKLEAIRNGAKKFQYYKELIQKDYKNNLDKSPEHYKKELEERLKERFGEIVNLEEGLSKEQISQYKFLSERDRRNRKLEIEKVQHDLADSPPKENFKGFPSTLERKHDGSPAIESNQPSLQEVRLILAKLPPELKTIFTKYFEVQFNSSNYNQDSTEEANRQNQAINATSGGAIVQPFKTSDGENRFRIVVDRNTFLEERDEKFGNITLQAVYFNLEKFAYTVVRSILSTINEDKKKDFYKILKKEGFKENIDDNCDNMDDWLAIAFSNPDQAKKLRPTSLTKTKPFDLNSAALKWLKNGYSQDDFLNTSQTSNTFIRSRKLNEKVLDKSLQTWKDGKSGEEIKGFWRWLLQKNETMGKFAYSAFEFYNYFKGLHFIDWQERYMRVAEDDAKEVKKLLSLDRGGGDYIGMLNESKYYNDPDNMRVLLLTIATKGAYQWPLVQFYLYRFDPLFTKSKGREITRDSFDAVTRIAKAAGKANSCVVLPPYVQKGNRFVRYTYNQQVKKADDVYSTLSLRDLQKTRPDIFANLFDSENGKFIDFDAQLGGKDADGNQIYGKSGTIFCSNDMTLYDPKMQSGVFKGSHGKDVEQFVADMKNFGQENGEGDKFTRIADPAIVSWVRRMVQESYSNPELFNMFTPPKLKEGFKHYTKDKDLGVSKESQETYKKEYQNLRKELEKKGFDIFEVIRSDELEDLIEKYKELTKDVRTFPYEKGRQKTKYGKLLERIDHSKNIIGSLDLPEEISSNILAAFDEIRSDKQLSIEKIDSLHGSLKRQLSSLDPVKSNKLQTELYNAFRYFKDLGVVRQYQRLFSPFEQTYYKYSREKRSTANKNQIENLEKFYHINIKSGSNNVSDMIKNIEQNNHADIFFTEDEKNTIENASNIENQLELLDRVFANKLRELSSPPQAVFEKHQQDLDLLYFDVSKAIQYPNQYRGSLDEFIKRLRTNNLIPLEVREQKITSFDELRTLLKPAKAVADAQREENRNRQQQGFASDFYERLAMEEEYEESL